LEEINKGITQVVAMAANNRLSFIFHIYKENGYENKKSLKSKLKNLWNEL